jgi:hypothetical protein
LPGVNGIALKATKETVSGVRIARLTWKGAAGNNVKLFVNGNLRRITANDGWARVTLQKPRTFTFKMCETGTNARCSNSASVTR